MNKWLAIIVILAMATASNAAITGYLDGGTPVTLSDGNTVVVNKLLVDTDTDWTNAYLNITLSAGSFYEYPTFGTDTEPNPALIAIFPDLAYDSYLDTPAAYPSVASFAPGKVISPTVYDVSWFDDPNFPDGPGVGQQIAQLTFTPDAYGTIEAIVFDTDSAGMGVEVLGFMIMDGGLGGPPPDPPIAQTLESYEIDVGETLILDASGSFGSAPMFEWDLDNNGSYETSGGYSAVFGVDYSHLEGLGLGPSETPYPIHLRVTDDFGSDTADSMLTIVPEPATLILLAAGMALILRKRRR